MDVEFSEWITKKYVEWRGARVGRGSSIADFAKEFGASQPVMSRWMKSGSNPPTSAKYVNALYQMYGDEVLEVMGIEKPLESIDLAQLPDELRERLSAAITELNMAYEREGVEAGSPEAFDLAVKLLGKYGFDVSKSTKENSG